MILALRRPGSWELDLERDLRRVYQRNMLQTARHQSLESTICSQITGLLLQIAQNGRAPSSRTLNVSWKLLFVVLLENIQRLAETTAESQARPPHPRIVFTATEL